MKLPKNAAWNWGTAVEHEVNMIKPYVHGRILDYGCGTGRLTKALGAIGYDPDPTAVGYVRAQGLEATTVPPCDFDSAFSVLVFQHLPDLVVYDILEFIHPRPFVFQFVVGNERAVLSYQRSPDEMLELCEMYDDFAMEPDPIHDEWRWVTLR